MSQESNSGLSDDLRGRYKVWFFAGGESGNNKFNVFTGSFIRLMRQILENDFELVKGIYYRLPVSNVVWALNHSQKPVTNPQGSRIIEAAFQQITHEASLPGTQIVIVSSSSGSVVAAQAACFLAKKHKEKQIFAKPFHIALGATMISKESELFALLLKYQDEGIISKIIYDDLQDEGDSSNGVGSTTRVKAWANAFGLMFPWFSKKYMRPSFLNTNPVRGHLHRRRSQTLRKALDFVEVILVKHNLAGDHYRQRVLSVLEQKAGKIELDEQSLS